MDIGFFLKKINPAQGVKKFHRFISVLSDNCRVFFFTARPVNGPASIVWDVTNSCNLKCGFCKKRDIGKEGSPGGKPGLTRADRIAIIDKIADAGVWLLSFCGGEPLLCEDLDALIRRAKYRGLVVNVSTNGFLLEAQARKLVDAGVDLITISIDSHDPGVLDNLRGQDGHFDRVIKGLRALRALRKIRRVFVESRCLINRANCFALDEFVRFWRDKVDFITFKPIYENPLVGYHLPQGMRIPLEEKERFEHYFSRLLKKHRFLNNSYNRLIPKFLFTPSELNRKFFCFAGTFFAGIDPWGNLLPCHEMSVLPNQPVGNLRDEDFMAVWRKSGLASLRKSFKAGLRCNCWMDRFLLNIYLQRLLYPIDRLLNGWRS